MACPLSDLLQQWCQPSQEYRLHLHFLDNNILITYNWRVKDPKFLANSGSVSLAGAPQTNLEMGQMKAGDCNNDNVVTILDFNILKGTFGKAQGDPGYDDRADFTGDHTVTISDFNLLKGNFGQGGSPPIRPGGP